MGVARVHRRASLQQEDCLPLSSYDDAVKRLVFVRVVNSQESFDVAATLVADIFWTTDLKVLRDVLVLVRQIGG